MRFANADLARVFSVDNNAKEVMWINPADPDPRSVKVKREKDLNPSP